MIDELPKLRFTYAEWKQKTSSFGVVRSRELEAIDRWLHDYIARPNWGDLRLLRQALETWKKKYKTDDAWMKSRRNDNGDYIVAELNAELSGKGDTDTAFGVPSFMAEDLEHSRMGLLYLFGHTQRQVDVYKIITSGAFAFVGSGLEFLGSMVDSAADATKAVGKVMDLGKEKVEAIAKTRDEKRAPARPGLPSGSLSIQTEMTTEQMRTVDSAKLNTLPSSVPLTADQSRLSKAFQDALNSRVIVFLKEKGPATWESYGGKILRGICDIAAKKLFSSGLVDIVGGSLSIIPSLIKLVEDVFLMSANWLSKRRVAILPGTPSAIVDGLENAMGMNLANDLYASLKGGASLGLTIVSASLGSAIMGFVCAVVELLVKTAWRLWELSSLGYFLEEAREKLIECKTTEFHRHPFAYNKWFREHVNRAPVIAALALNSNLCHNMHFLQMFQDGQMITESQYQGAMVNFTRLKEYSSRYIEDSGYILSSNDELVKKWLEPGKRMNEDTAWRKFALKPVLDFMG